MAAYAAVVSLMNNLDQIGNHPHLSSCFDHNQIQSLRANLTSLLEFVERVGVASKKVKVLERRIASAAHAAEDVIESRVVDQLPPSLSPLPPSRLHHRATSVALPPPPSRLRRPPSATTSIPLSSALHSFIQGRKDKVKWQKWWNA